MKCSNCWKIDDGDDDGDDDVVVCDSDSRFKSNQQLTHNASQKLKHADSLRLNLQNWSNNCQSHRVAWWR